MTSISTVVWVGLPSLAPKNGSSPRSSLRAVPSKANCIFARGVDEINIWRPPRLFARRRVCRQEARLHATSRYQGADDRSLEADEQEVRDAEVVVSRRCPASAGLALS